MINQKTIIELKSLFERDPQWNSRQLLSPSVIDVECSKLISIFLESSCFSFQNRRPIHPEFIIKFLIQNTTLAITSKVSGIDSLLNQGNSTIFQLGINFKKVLLKIKSINHDFSFPQQIRDLANRILNELVMSMIIIGCGAFSKLNPNVTSGLFPKSWKIPQFEIPDEIILNLGIPIIE